MAATSERSRPPVHAQVGALVLFLAEAGLSACIGTLWLCLRSVVRSLCESFPSQAVKDTSIRPLLGDDREYGEAYVLDGRVVHHRRHPITHRFHYPVRYAVINLDSIPWWLQDDMTSNHLSASAARDMAGTTGPVYLLTIPRSLGYEQNPLSVYYCYDEPEPAASPSSNGSTFPDTSLLRVCIAEVTNTPWSDRVTFLFSPENDNVPKPLHVSPFMDMDGTWHMQVQAPSAQSPFSLKIHLHHARHGAMFTAVLSVRLLPPFSLGWPARGSSSLPLPSQWTREAFEWAVWLMPHRAAFWIYWQAVVLWVKGVQVFDHPKYEQSNNYGMKALDLLEGVGYKGDGKWLKLRSVSGSQEANASAASSDITVGCPFRWRSSTTYPWN